MSDYYTTCKMKIVYLDRGSQNGNENSHYEGQGLRKRSFIMGGKVMRNENSRGVINTKRRGSSSSGNINRRAAQETTLPSASQRRKCQRVTKLVSDWLRDYKSFDSQDECQLVEYFNKYDFSSRKTETL